MILGKSQKLKVKEGDNWKKKKKPLTFMLDKIQCADRALVLDRRWDTSSI